MTEELQVGDVAELLGLTPARVRQLIVAGTLPAVLRRGRWFVRPADVALARARRRPGRPPNAPGGRAAATDSAPGGPPS